MGLRFGLQVPTFDWPGGAAKARATLGEIGRAAEDAGFESVWVMDHYRQIPMFGPAWHDMLDSYTTLAFLAAQTERVRLGTLVTAITHRPVAQLGKIIATLDVVSGGRANCGLGVGWFAAETAALGMPFPPLAERYALLEDALEFLPLFWGKGAPAFDGRVLRVPEALCYPRPLQDHVPILVGGNGEARTLRLAARYADACNIIGEADVVARKVDALRSHCEAAGRPSSSVEVTQLSTTLVGKDSRELSTLVESLRPRRTSAEQYAARVNAGTVDDQLGRFRALAQAGVQTAIVSFPDLVDTASDRTLPRRDPRLRALTDTNSSKNSRVRELEREVEDAVVVPIDDAEVGARIDQSHLVPDPVRHGRRLRVVEDDALFLVEPAGLLVDLRPDPVQVQRRDLVEQLALVGVEDLPLPRDEVNDFGRDLRELAAGRDDHRSAAFASGDLARRARAEQLVEFLLRTCRASRRHVGILVTSNSNRSQVSSRRTRGSVRALASARLADVQGANAFVLPRRERANAG